MSLPGIDVRVNPEDASGGSSLGSLWSLTWASFGMFFGCYIAGSIPLTLPLSESKTRAMSVFGSGLLIGTALSVILPEGLSIVQNAHLHPDCINNDVIFSPDSIDPSELHETPNKESRKDGKVVKADLDHLHRELSGDDNNPKKDGPQSMSSEETSKEDEDNVNRVIGLSLVFGFVFMLIVDHISVGSHSHGPSHAIDSESQHKGDLNGNGRSRSKFTTTLGLLVHAAADGIAMAAVSATSKSDLQLIVFLAIMLHKFPASFGLVSFLMSEKTDRQRIRRHLMAFSLSAPVGAFLTYFFLVLSSSAFGTESSLFSDFSGKAMLFSAGTFLYVATIHILPNIQHSSPGGHLSSSHVLLLMLGAFCPTLLNLLHHHEHHSH